MFYWMKPLPPAEIDHSKAVPFIHNEWFRNHFMIFVYILQGSLLLASILVGAWRFTNLFVEIGLYALVFLIHECLHILVVFRRGDLSITHSGIFFWLNSDARMSKLRFLTFMSLPLVVLTVVPAIVMYLPVCPAELVPLLKFVAWINAIIAGADIINAPLILIKPAKAVFHRGFYTV
ncbi:MAG: DUF3267 domain-containing protein [Lachnospiraceae bacterium]|nr:DUF3267 domain-containing protein [Lachnospiraceae bacterium]